MSFKVGDRVLCSRRNNKVYKNMVGTVDKHKDTLDTSYNPEGCSYLVLLDTNPHDFIMLNREWSFQEDEMRLLTPLDKLL